MQIIEDFLEKHHIQDDTFAVGVSGGADSLALVLMFKQEFPQYRIIALTVDHGLRPSSRDEALYVADVMQRFNIEHHILTWEGEKPVTGIEEQARLMRYRLLCQWCHNNHINYLAIAHHLFDQAETFLMRLERGSGLNGLCAMSDISERDGIKLLRPLLNTSPEILKTFLEQQKIMWVEDESNQCLDFLRVKMRHFLPILEKETGISAECLSQTATTLQKTRDFIEDIVNQTIDDHIHKWGNAGVSVDYALYLSWHEELKFRVLSKLICTLGQTAYIPKAEKLLELIKCLDDKNYEGGTLGGCYLLISDLRLWIIKERRGEKKIYSTQKWEDFILHNPEVRGVHIPHKLRLSLLAEK